MGMRISQGRGTAGTGERRGSSNLLASPPPARYHLTLMNEITQLLSALGQGDPHAASRLLPLVYDELRKLAAQPMAPTDAPG